ncbi:hypothetical protein GCM10007358_12390 [Phocicoccus schoeneichii]|uniref:Uncharacterized protein n=1 Tax=Phocicoccus schoeneichii TaxID=1812261 RepID=A0A6V7R9E8_9BACL|nr:hypothetical protein [Jeotgalicoccus schoeneichii]GGH53240.1 hypothetical protein GCM10007358_12390 [Jeotgalicoccus schoeneichii]CAD2073896.1 hypothetical protein JEOSCH030_00581 [Jeotgalicoccus schoeneichii]
MDPKGYIVNYFITNNTSGIMQYMLVKDKDIDSDEVEFYLGTVRINDNTTEALLQGFLAAQPVMVQAEEYRTDNSSVNRGISSYEFAKRFAMLSNYELLEFGIPNVLETVRDDRFQDTIVSPEERRKQEEARRSESVLKEEIDREVATTSPDEMLEIVRNTFMIFKTDVGVMNKVGTLVDENNALLGEALTPNIVREIDDNIREMLENPYVIKNYTLELTRVSRFLEEIMKN